MTLQVQIVNDETAIGFYFRPIYIYIYVYIYIHMAYYAFRHSGIHEAMETGILKSLNSQF